MLSRQFRFHGRTTLLRLYKRSQTLRASYFSIKYVPLRPGQPFRAAVVVSKKVSKSAVVRNRIRRRVFEVIRHYDAEQPLIADIVVTVFDEQVAIMPAALLTAELNRLLQKLPTAPARAASPEPPQSAI